MRARILLRNSTDRQAKAGTVAAQRGPVRKLAVSLGATEIVEYLEEAVSGAAPLDERDVLRKLLAEAEAGDLVVAFDMSRLTRSDDWIERYTVLGHLRRARLRPATVADGEIHLDTIGGRITTHVRAEIAADERTTIRRRMHAGKANAAERGQKPQGATPYGYRYDRTAKQWSVDQREADVVRGIVERIIAGESCGAVAIALNRAGVNVPKRGTSPASPRWTARRVWHLVTRPIYRGEWSFDGRAIAVPAIVDTDTWQRAQAALLAAGRRGLRRTQHVYLLDEGHGRCGLCGAPLHIHYGGTTGYSSYYVCARRLADKACDLQWWRTDEADALVWQEVRRVLERPDLLEEALRARAVDAESDGGAGDGDVAASEAQLARLATVREVLTTQYRRERITAAELERELDAVDRQRRLLEQTLAAARYASERARAAVAEIGSMRAYLLELGEQLDVADAVAQRVIARAVAPDVVLDREQVKIGLRLRAPEAIAVGLHTCSCRGSHCEISVTVEKRAARSR